MSGGKRWRKLRNAEEGQRERERERHTLGLLYTTQNAVHIHNTSIWCESYRILFIYNLSVCRQGFLMKMV